MKDSVVMQDRSGSEAALPVAPPVLQGLSVIPLDVQWLEPGQTVMPECWDQVKTHDLGIPLERLRGHGCRRPIREPPLEVLCDRHRRGLQVGAALLFVEDADQFALRVLLRPVDGHPDLVAVPVLVTLAVVDDGPILSATEDVALHGEPLPFLFRPFDPLSAAVFGSFLRGPSKPIDVA